MFGAIQFAKMAGRKLGGMFKGKKGKEALDKEVSDLGLDTDGVDIHVDDDGKITLKGKAVSQELKEKIILAVGNVSGVGEVHDEVETDDDGTASQFHEVVSGDTLWAVSKKYYGKGSRYMEIFEANKPMLSHPDKIYVGQMLRIPADNTASA
ncbi:MAG TPA: peptidoglycan-binding protein LysM [Hellea balneolensis]|uniref:Peptidoglycan-binding protein LysM n=1 Tax=Hellea balneolensis TaxID=287478 RepID=A0A7C3FYR4_9PROT|nr:peptidoglycan-binding protein LysM [Hellea balneolensis]